MHRAFQIWGLIPVAVSLGVVTNFIAGMRLHRIPIAWLMESGNPVVSVSRVADIARTVKYTLIPVAAACVAFGLLPRQSMSVFVFVLAFALLALALSACLAKIQRRSAI